MFPSENISANLVGSPSTAAMKDPAEKN